MYCNESLLGRKIWEYYLRNRELGSLVISYNVKFLKECSASDILCRVLSLPQWKDTSAVVTTKACVINKIEASILS